MCTCIRVIVVHSVNTPELRLNVKTLKIIYKIRATKRLFFPEKKITNGRKGAYHDTFGVAQLISVTTSPITDYMCCEFHNI